jgi:hypothetical protein
MQIGNAKNSVLFAAFLAFLNLERLKFKNLNSKNLIFFKNLEIDIYFFNFCVTCRIMSAVCPHCILQTCYGGLLALRKGVRLLNISGFKIT